MSRDHLGVVAGMAVVCFLCVVIVVGLSHANPPARTASAAEVAMAAVADLAVQKVDGAVRVEFINVNEGNSLAHQDKRTYSGVAQPYDKSDKPLGIWGQWHARVIRKNGQWKVDKDSLEFEQPKPAPVKK